jgi:hypothetical protein
VADDQFSTRVAANGTATVTFTPTKNLPWLLQQVSIEHANAPSGCTAELRKNGNLITVMLATDVADSDPPIPVAPGDRMQVNWFNATPNASVAVYIIYQTVDWAAI